MRTVISDPEGFIAIETLRLPAGITNPERKRKLSRKKNLIRN